MTEPTPPEPTSPAPDTDRVEVTVVTQPDCAFCEIAEGVLARVGQDYPLTVHRVDLGSEHGRDLAARHGVLFAPGVLLDGEMFGYGRLSERRLRRELSRRAAALDRVRRMGGYC